MRRPRYHRGRRGRGGLLAAPGHCHELPPCAASRAATHHRRRKPRAHSAQRPGISSSAQYYARLYRCYPAQDYSESSRVRRGFVLLADRCQPAKALALQIGYFFWSKFAHRSLSFVHNSGRSTERFFLSLIIFLRKWKHTLLTPRRMMLERGVHSNWAKNAWALENGRESGYD